MQIKQTITLFGTVSNSATSRTSKNGRKYTAFGVAIIADRNLQAFHYNVVAFGKQGHFAKPLQKGTRIKLVVQAQSQPDNIATLPHSSPQPSCDRFVRLHGGPRQRLWQLHKQERDLRGEELDRHLMAKMLSTTALCSPDPGPEWRRAKRGLNCCNGSRY
jgi:hypothetical protein